MQFLSEFQIKLISDFRERVRQSERRLHETLDQSKTSQGPRSPEMLPLIRTYDDMSKISDTHNSQSEDKSQNLIPQETSTEDFNSPPQKHLQTTIFNESPTDHIETGCFQKEDFQTHERVIENNKVGDLPENGREDSKNAKKLLSVTFNNKISDIFKEKNHQNLSGSLERQKLDEAYKNFLGMSDEKKNSNKKASPFVRYEEQQMYEHEFFDNGAKKFNQGSYESEDTEYLERKKYHDVESERSQENKVPYNSNGGERRLKVPSIRVFEEGQMHNSNSAKTTPYSAQATNKQKSQENRSILGNRDLNASNSKELSNHLEKNQMKRSRKAPSYPKKTNMSCQDDLTKGGTPKRPVNKADIENQNIVNNQSSSIPRSKRNDNQTQKNKIRSSSLQRGCNEKTYMKSPSRGIKENEKINRDIRARVSSEIAVESEKQNLAKEVLRKYKLGTVDHSRLIKVLEDHMNSSQSFYEDFKELLKK